MNVTSHINFKASILLISVFFVSCNQKIASHKQARIAIRNYLTETEKGIALSQEKDFPDVVVIGIKEKKKDCVAKIKYRYWKWKEILMPHRLYEEDITGELQGSYKVLKHYKYLGLAIENNFIRLSENINEMDIQISELKQRALSNKKGFKCWLIDILLSEDEKVLEPPSTKKPKKSKTDRESVWTKLRNLPLIKHPNSHISFADIFCPTELCNRALTKYNGLSQDKKKQINQDYFHETLIGGISYLVETKPIDYLLVKYDTGWICEGYAKD